MKGRVVRTSYAPAMTVRRYALTLAIVALVGANLVLYLRPAPSRSGGPVMVEDNMLARARTQFGPDRFSEGPEEWLIRDFFGNQRDGVFVDIGAFEAVQWSNTYRLERDLGWRGLAVDVLEEFSAGYRQQRPRTRFVVAFVAGANDGMATIHINPSQKSVSSSTRDFTARFTQTMTTRDVPIRIMDSLLDEAGITTIDLLSMDIELGEPTALQHFSIARYRPRLVVVEAHGETRQAILDYFARADYVLVGKYLNADRQNLYFTPLPANTPEAQ